MMDHAGAVTAISRCGGIFAAMQIRSDSESGQAALEYALVLGLLLLALVASFAFFSLGSIISGALSDVVAAVAAAT